MKVRTRRIWMTETAKTRWLVQGTGHWIMVVAVWMMTLAAGMKLADAGAGWLERLWLTAFSAFFWVVALRTKRSQG
jgi:hypothetical protein